MRFKLIIMFLLLVAVSVQGQLSSFGFKAGPVVAEQHWAYSPQSGITAVGISPIWGIDVGSFYEVLKTENFALQAEVHYVQKGRTVRVMVTVPANNPRGYIDLGFQNIKHRVTYLSFPVFARFYLNMGSFRPYIALGPSLEYLIIHPPSNVYEQFKKAEVAVLVCVGAEIDLGLLPRLLAEVKYTDSLTNSFHTENVTVTTRSLAFLVGVLFD